MSRRLQQLRSMLAFIEHEIALEEGPQIEGGVESPLVVAVSALYEVDPAHVIAGGRGHRVTRARHALAWLLHREGMSQVEICNCLGYTDAGSVRYALRQTAQRHGVTAMLLAQPGIAPHVGEEPRIIP